jgi:hypothetical protein
MVKLWCSASDRIRVPARPAQHVQEAFQTCDAGRARVHRPSEAGTPDMTIGRAAADHARARPSCAGGRAAGSHYFSGCTHESALLRTARDADSFSTLDLCELIDE